MKNALLVQSTKWEKGQGQVIAIIAIAVVIFVALFFIPASNEQYEERLQIENQKAMETEMANQKAAFAQLPVKQESVEVLPWSKQFPHDKGYLDISDGNAKTGEIADWDIKYESFNGGLLAHVVVSVNGSDPIAYDLTIDQEVPVANNTILIVLRNYPEISLPVLQIWTATE